MDKTCRECGQELPGLEIPLGQSIHEAPEILVLEFEDGYDFKASAKRFAKWCYANARAGWMDEFRRAYKHEEAGR